jgi:hypothetical protein
MTTITYRAPSGRLALDRYDFQDHITGSNFRHTASQVDLNPAVTINSIPRTDVQSAISALSSLVVSGAPDASTSVKGLVKLTNDFGGTASLPKVTGLQGIPISTLTPSINNVLAFNGSAWVPSSSTSAFLPGGDLSGTYNSQQVVKLTGSSGNIYVDASKLTLQNDFEISYANTVSIPHDLLIKGQSSTLIGENGGNINLQSGDGLYGAGEIALNLGTTGSSLGLTEIQPGQFVTFLTGKPNFFNLPYGTGSGIVFIGDAITPPSNTLPGGGVILYSNSGKLHCRHSNGDDIQIGATPNPTSWGYLANSKYSSRSESTTTTSIAQSLTSFIVYYNTGGKIDAVVLGKDAFGTEYAQYRLQWAFSRYGSTLIPVGTLSISEVVTTAGASGWTQPTITFDNALSRIYINTGCNLNTTINWFCVLDVLFVG